MLSPRRTPFLVALLVPLAALGACADDRNSSSSSSSDSLGDADATTTSAADGDTDGEGGGSAATGTGKGTFVVGDRSYAFEARRCTAEEGDPVGTVLADGKGAFDGRPFTVTVKSSPGDTSAIETVQVVFAATEAVVGTNFVQLPGGAADIKLEVREDGKATGTIPVMGTGGQPSGEGTLTLECDAD